MGYMKRVSTAFLFGAANGTLFYMLAGVAEPIFPAVTPVLGGAIGFFSAAGIELMSVADDKD